MTLPIRSARWKILLAMLVLATSLSACASIPTGAHYDHASDFSGYRSYSWIAANPLILGSGEQSSISPLTQSYITRTIGAELERKDYTFADSPAEADFIVCYTLGTRATIDAYSYPATHQGDWGWHLYGRHYYTSQVHHRSYTEGTLSIDIFDGKSRQPVWHGWAGKTISDANRQKPSPIIKKAVAQIFEQFPPGQDAFDSK